MSSFADVALILMPLVILVYGFVIRDIRNYIRYKRETKNNILCPVQDGEAPVLVLEYNKKFAKVKYLIIWLLFMAILVFLIFTTTDTAAEGQWLLILGKDKAYVIYYLILQSMNAIVIITLVSGAINNYFSIKVIFLKSTLSMRMPYLKKIRCYCWMIRI